MERLWTPDDLGPSLAARPQAARRFEMLIKRNNLEHFWSLNGLGPGLAGRPQAIFGFLLPQ